MPNPSFEENSQCPGSFGEIENAIFWVNPTSATPDYFNICSTTPDCQIPINFYGNQTPHTGEAYAGIALYYDPNIIQNYREYIQVSLIQELEQSKYYCFSFYYSYAGKKTFGITDNIEVFISTNSPSNFTGWPPEPLQNIIPQLKTDIAIDDTTNWILFSALYQSQGGEKYITIGNFKNDSQTNIFPSTANLGDYILIYVDDVSLIECDTTLAIKIPNVFTPNGDQLNENFVIENLPANCNLTIYSRWGNVVYSNPNYGNNWDGEMNSSGVYYYVLSLPSGEIKKGTVTILRE